MSRRLWYPNNAAVETCFQVLARRAVAEGCTLFDATEMRVIGIEIDNALDSTTLSIRWGIDPWIGGLPPDQSWEVSSFQHISSAGTEECERLWREAIAYIDVDSYEDVLAQTAEAARHGVASAQLPVATFIRLNFGGGCTQPLLEHEVVYIGADEAYPIAPAPINQ